MTHRGTHRPPDIALVRNHARFLQRLDIGVKLLLGFEQFGQAGARQFAIGGETIALQPGLVRIPERRGRRQRNEQRQMGDHRAHHRKALLGIGKLHMHMHAAHHVAVADAAEILDHLLVARFRARLRHSPDRGRMRAAGHDGKAVFAGDLGDLAAQEAQLLARVADVDMDIARDLELRLQHLAHGLAAGRPVRRLEQLVRRLHGDIERAPVGEEIFLLDAEGIFGDFLAPRGGADDEMLPVVAQAQPQLLQEIEIECHVKSYGPATILPEATPATAANGPSGSSRPRDGAACAEQNPAGRARASSPSRTRAGRAHNRGTGR